MAFMRSFVFLFVGVSALDLALDDQDDVREEEESFGEVEATTDDVAEASSLISKKPCCIPYRTDYGSLNGEGKIETILDPAKTSSHGDCTSCEGKCAKKCITVKLPGEGECFENFDFYWTSPKNVPTGFSTINNKEVPDFLTTDTYPLEAAASVQVSGVCCENEGWMKRKRQSVAAYFAGVQGNIDRCVAHGLQPVVKPRLEAMVDENNKASGADKPYKDLHFVKPEEAFKHIDSSNLIEAKTALEFAKQTFVAKREEAAQTIQQGVLKRKEKQAEKAAADQLAADQAAAQKKAGEGKKELFDSLEKKEREARGAKAFARNAAEKSGA